MLLVEEILLFLLFFFFPPTLYHTIEFEVSYCGLKRCFAFLSVKESKACAETNGQTYRGRRKGI